MTRSVTVYGLFKKSLHYSSLETTVCLTCIITTGYKHLTLIALSDTHMNKMDLYHEYGEEQICTILNL